MIYFDLCLLKLTQKVRRTGELVMMGCHIFKPYFLLGVISADGKQMLHKVDLKFKSGANIIHDVGVTENYNIILDYPQKFGIERPILRKPFIEFDQNGKSRIGVMPRFGDQDSLLWFDVKNHCTYHIINCFEDGDKVISIHMIIF
ncbi:putative 9-cis-epoxycarotenoid dioxygenase [Dioscorea sansibarensis]